MWNRSIALVICLALSAPLWAREAPPDAPPLAVLRVALELSDEQVDGVRQLLEERSARVKAATDEIEGLEAELRVLLRGETPDPAEVGGIVLDTSALKQEMREAQAAFQDAFDSLMSPDQQQRLDHLHRLAHAHRVIEALRDLRIH